MLISQYDRSVILKQIQIKYKYMERPAIESPNDRFEHSLRTLRASDRDVVNSDKEKDVRGMLKTSLMHALDNVCLQLVDSGKDSILILSGASVVNDLAEHLTRTLPFVVDKEVKSALEKDYVSYLKYLCSHEMEGTISNDWELVDTREGVSLRVINPNLASDPRSPNFIRDRF